MTWSGLSFERLTDRSLRAWSTVVRRFAWPIVAASIVAAALALVYTIKEIRIDTSTTDLVAQDLPFLEHARAYKKAFQGDALPIVVVIEGETPEAASRVATLLGEKLAADKAYFKRHYDALADPFLRTNGLLLMKEEQLWDVSDRIALLHPILARLARDATLGGLLSTLTEALTHIAEDPSKSTAPLENLLDQLARSAEGQLDGKRVPVSWISHLTGGDKIFGGKTRVIQVAPVRDFSKLRSTGKAIERIRHHVASLDLGPDAGVRVRLTGPAVMSDEELASVVEDVSRAGLVALVLVAVVLGVGIRSLQMIVALLATLVVGLAWTLGLATFLFDAFNLISVAFAVLFIGLSIDFGIHYALRFGEAVGDGEAKEGALETAAVEVGPALLVATGTTAIAFLAFVPTNYTGLAELGMISAIGIVLALFANLTLLPALILVLPSRGRLPVVVGAAVTSWTSRAFGRAAGPILVLGLVATAIGAIDVGRLRFDLNPINLRDPGAESVRTFYDIVASGAIAPYAVYVVRDSLPAAVELAPQLGALETVASAKTAQSFVPKSQAEKSQVIDQIWTLMGPIIDDSRQQSPSTDVERRLAIERFVRHMSPVADGMPQGTLRSQLQGLVAVMPRLLEGDDRQLGAFEDDATGTIPVLMSTLEEALQGGREIGLDQVPDSIRTRFLADDGRAVIQVEPRETSIDVDTVRRFVDDVRAVAPTVTGAPILIMEMGRAIVDSLIMALVIAVAGITVFVTLALRSLRDTLLVVLPLLVAMVLTITAAVEFGLAFNFANLIVLPLMVGLGADYAVHVVMRNRQIGDPRRFFATSTPRAIVLSALTTIVSFGSLSISDHWGMASMGIMLTIAILLAIVVTLVLLPASIRVWKRAIGITPSAPETR